MCKENDMSTTMRRALPCALMLLALGVPAGAQAACLPNSPQVIVCHAGSLTAAFSPVEALFTQQTGICVSDLSGGSVDLGRQVTAGKVPCDVYAPADFEIIDLFLEPAGYADFDILFAQGGMVLAYTTDSKNASSNRQARRFQPSVRHPGRGG
jgi:ABC-type molybdate transport system substrate-binding protein